jgi:carbamoyltransferase
MKTLLLGLNAFHGDSAAATLVDGRFACGIEEERLNRIKHWAGFPSLAIEAVLGDSGARLADVAHVAVSRDPSAHMLSKVLFTFKKRPGLDAITARLKNHGKFGNLETLLKGVPGGERFKGEIHNVEHHRAHLASTFFPSPFEEAACLTIDGFGDFLSSMSAVGRGNKLEILDHVMYPHSLGIFYSAVTQFLGFPKYGDEYKVMGLSSYGTPEAATLRGTPGSAGVPPASEYLNKMREMVRLTDNGQFTLDLDYFVHTSEGVTMSWDNGEPVIGKLFSEKFETLLGPAREPNTELTERHWAIAAAMQAMYEEAFFHRLRWLQKKTGLKALCLAGGCALNSVANGKIFRETGFTDVFIQSAAGDAGTSLGAAQWVWHQELGHPREWVMEHSYYGPKQDDGAIAATLRQAFPGFDGSLGFGESATFDGITIRRLPDETLIPETAAAIANGEIVGWYQGRSEWGPRALGNRSIVVDPRRAEMKDVLNARIKRREPFRPFAPSILEEAVGEYFTESYPDPFMIKVYPVRPEKRESIPAVTHVDGTGRLQSVSKTQNPRYWGLINAFGEKTGVPVVLNTSFNENEPIVNTPTEALNCFLRTKMHRIVLENMTLTREAE